MCGSLEWDGFMQMSAGHANFDFSMKQHIEGDAYIYFYFIYSRYLFMPMKSCNTEDIFVYLLNKKEKHKENLSLGWSLDLLIYIIKCCSSYTLHPNNICPQQ